MPDAGDLAEFGHAAIVGRQEREEAGATAAAASVSGTPARPPACDQRLRRSGSLKRSSR